VRRKPLGTFLFILHANLLLPLLLLLLLLILLMLLVMLHWGCVPNLMLLCSMHDVHARFDFQNSTGQLLTHSQPF
jgi:hypothetical protein